MNGLAVRLREKGLKVTPQRMAIYGMLCSTASHPTAEQVWGVIREQFPAVSFNTVYTTLGALERCGLIQRLHIGENAAHYDANAKPHVHFTCRGCAQVFDCEDIPEVDLRPLTDELKRGKGYSVDKIELNVYGLCGECVTLED